MSRVYRDQQGQVGAMSEYGSTDAEESSEARTRLCGHSGPNTCTRWLSNQPIRGGQQLQHLQDARQEAEKLLGLFIGTHRTHLGRLGPGISASRRPRYGFAAAIEAPTLAARPDKKPPQKRDFTSSF